MSENNRKYSELLTQMEAGAASYPEEEERARLFTSERFAEAPATSQAQAQAQAQLRAQQLQAQRAQQLQAQRMAQQTQLQAQAQPAQQPSQPQPKIPLMQEREEAGLMKQEIQETGKQALHNELYDEIANMDEEVTPGLPSISDMIVHANKIGSSDVHLVCGMPPKCRLDGHMVDLTKHALTPADCRHYAQELSKQKFPQIEQIGELDLARTYEGIRVRINVFHQQGTFSAALRILNNKIPKLSTLGLPPAVLNFSKMKRGIVLVTGVTGSGKSTTLAGILDDINHTRAEHIITLEDPIEYIYTPDKCVINQREIGKDTESFDNGLRAILREDPDVILIGEMRDLKSIEIALTAAETGHLVFGTLHTKSAADAVDRMIEIFPGDRQKQIRMQVSTCLNAVLSQQLVVRKGGGRCLACELMIVTPAIRNLIREAKTPQITSAISTNIDNGSITMDASLVKLVNDKLIDKETAIAAAQDPEEIKKQLRMKG